MLRTLSILVLLILTCISVQKTYATDRITLFHGDIFIGDELEFKDGRYLHERFGFKTRTPYWFVKKIENDINTLELTATKSGTLTTDTLKVFGDRILSVTSQEPMETSNLELHPWRSDHWIAAERYIRGYIVNRSQVGYNVLRASIVFYGKDKPGTATEEPKKVRLMDEQIAVFKLYPNTMKPFIVDAWMVPWDKVESIQIIQTGEVPMIRNVNDY